MTLARNGKRILVVSKTGGEKKMATVKMFKGNIIADIYDSEETIAQAKKDGYLPVEEESKAKKTESDESEVKIEKKTRTARQ